MIIRTGNSISFLNVVVISFIGGFVTAAGVATLFYVNYGNTGRTRHTQQQKQEDNREFSLTEGSKAEDDNNNPSKGEIGKQCIDADHDKKIRSSVSSTPSLRRWMSNDDVRINQIGELPGLRRRSRWPWDRMNRSLSKSSSNGESNKNHSSSTLENHNQQQTYAGNQSSDFSNTSTRVANCRPSSLSTADDTSDTGSCTANEQNSLECKNTQVDFPSQPQQQHEEDQQQKLQQDSDSNSSPSSTSKNEFSKSGFCIGNIFGIDVGGTLAKLAYFEMKSKEDNPRDSQFSRYRKRVYQHHEQHSSNTSCFSPGTQNAIKSKSKSNPSTPLCRPAIRSTTTATTRRSRSMTSRSSATMWTKTPWNDESHDASNNVYNDSNIDNSLQRTENEDKINSSPHRDIRPSSTGRNTAADDTAAMRGGISGVHSYSEGDFEKLRSWRRRRSQSEDINESSYDPGGITLPCLDEQDVPYSEYNTDEGGFSDDSYDSGNGNNHIAVDKEKLIPSLPFQIKGHQIRSMVDLNNNRDRDIALDRFYTFARRLHSYREAFKDDKLSFYSNELGGEFHFIRFETRRMQNAMDLIRENQLHVNIQEMGGTGGGAHRFAEQWEKELGIQMKKQHELDSLVAGMQFVLSTVVGECYTFRPSNTTSPNTFNKTPTAPAPQVKASSLGSKTDSQSKPSTSTASTRQNEGYTDVENDEASVDDDDDDDNNDNIDDKRDKGSGDIWWWSRKVQRDAISYSGTYPYLVVTIGTGVSILRVDGSRKYERVSGSTIGGGTYLGLIRLLTDVDEFDDIMRLAEKGDPSKCDMMIGDIYGDNPEALEKLGLPSHLVASSFGKLVTKEDPAAGIKQEDLARSLLLMITINIGQVAYLNAQLMKTSRIYFVGNFLRENKLSQQRLAYAIDYWSNGKMEALFLEHEGYLGALGAFLLTQEESTSVKTGQRKKDQ